MQCVTIIQVIGIKGLQGYGEGISRSDGVNRELVFAKFGVETKK